MWNPQQPLASGAELEPGGPFYAIVDGDNQAFDYGVRNPCRQVAMQYIATTRAGADAWFFASSVPLLGVAADDDTAVMGTNCGQSWTPGWYYNLRTDPRVEATHQNRTIKAIAGKTDGDEKQAIWSPARRSMCGPRSLFEPDHEQEIQILILSTGELQ